MATDAIAGTHATHDIVQNGDVGTYLGISFSALAMGGGVSKVVTAAGQRVTTWLATLGGAGGAGITRLYRAVSENEFNQLMKTGKFEIVPKSAQGKYFAEAIAHAQQWGEKFYGSGNFRIIQADFPTEVANQFFRWDKLDNIGPARFAELEQLINAVIREVK